LYSKEGLTDFALEEKLIYGNLDSMLKKEIPISNSKGRTPRKEFGDTRRRLNDKPNTEGAT
jgi:hypothetical protein